MQKGSIADVRVKSKYALASGRYWLEIVIVGKKFKKSITLFWKRQEKNLLSYSETYLERSRTINAAKAVNYFWKKLYRRCWSVNHEIPSITAEF